MKMRAERWDDHAKYLIVVGDRKGAVFIPRNLDQREQASVLAQLNAIERIVAAWPVKAQLQEEGVAVEQHKTDTNPENSPETPDNRD